MNDAATFVFREQGVTRALLDGRVRLADLEMQFPDVPVLVNGFTRMIRTLEFDVCEMSLATYLIARERGVPITAIPIFLLRHFAHGAVSVHRNAGIEVPRDLEGRTVGVNRGYTVTTSVWVRGMLADEYGLDLGSVTWARTGEEHVPDLTLPSNVTTLDESSSLEDLISSGRLAAATGITIENAGARPLIPDSESAAVRAVVRSGFYPINHTLVVRDALLASQPGLARRLFEAFAAAKSLHQEEACGEPSTPIERDLRTVREATGKDPLPYGVEPNRAMLALFVRYLQEQGILNRTIATSEMFAAETLEMIG